MKIVYFLAILVVACGSPSVKDLRAEGEIETRKLACLLSEIKTKDQLRKKISKIQNSYAKIADLMIQLRNLPDDLARDSEPTAASDELFVELARLYEMPGCRRLLESAQEEAIERLQKESIL
jgi:hypothetical protein